MSSDTALPFSLDMSHADSGSAAFVASIATLEQTRKTLLDAPPPEAASIFALPRQLPQEAVALAQTWRSRYKHLIVVGSGGSGLSARALGMLKNGLHDCGGGNTLHVLDNLDPETFDALMKSAPAKETCLFIVSKSGSTVETFAQSVAVLAHLRAGGADLSACVAACTVEGSNPLRALAAHYKFPVLKHDKTLCGRFSILSTVGLLPAAFLGMDVAALLRGARAALEHGLKIPAANNPACQAAAFQYASLMEGRNITVFMPYAERFYGLARWWRQSWAESLGKGGKGSTAIPALGTVDQHSQLQLYLDGPDDKCFTLVLTRCEGTGKTLPPVEAPLSYLSGHTLGDLLAAQQHGTLMTLAKSKRPLRILRVEKADEESMGALLMQLTLEILFVAALLDVNAYDQPAVEQSKQLSHDYLTTAL